MGNDQYKIQLIIEALNATNSELANLRKDMEGIRSSATEAGGAIGSMKMLLGELGLTITAAAAAWKSFDLAKESTLLAARVETLGVVMDVVGRNAGYSTTQLEGYARGVAQMGITTEESRQTVIRMAQANLDLGKSAQIARVAQDAAVIANMNSSDALSGILHGITTLQPEVLRTYGIIVNFEAAYKRYADTAGRSVASLSSQEKQQIALNAVLEQGERVSGAYAASIETVGKQLTSMKRYSDEDKLSFGEIFKPFLGAVVKDVTQTLKDIHSWFKDNPQVVKDWAIALGDGMRRAALAIRGVYSSIGNVFDTMKTPLMAVASFGGQLVGTLLNGFGILGAVVLPVITDRFNHLIKLLNAIVNLGMAFGTVMLDTVGAMGSALGSVVKAAFQAITGDFSGAKASLEGLFSGIYADRLKSNLEFVKGTVVGIHEELSSLMKNPITEMKDRYLKYQGIDLSGVVKPTSAAHLTPPDTPPSVKSKNDNKPQDAELATARQYAEESLKIQLAGYKEEQQQLAAALKTKESALEAAYRRGLITEQQYIEQRQQLAEQGLNDQIDVLMREAQAIQDSWAKRQSLYGANEQKEKSKDEANYLTQIADITSKILVTQEQIDLARQKGATDLLPYASFWEGMRKGWADYLDDVRKTFDQGKQLAKDAAQEMDRMFSDMFFDAMTGKFKHFSDYFKSFLQSLARLLANELAKGTSAGIANMIAQMAGAMGGRSGGSLSNGTSGANDMAQFAHTGRYFPRFHVGGMSSDEVPAILQTGEYVVSRRGVAALDAINNGLVGGSVNMKVEVTNQSSQPVSARTSSVQYDGARHVVGIVLEDINSYGPLYHALKAR